jgi:hypothetical protein
VLASTEELHNKIEAMSYRIRALEGVFELTGFRFFPLILALVPDALRESHAANSSDEHPLLNLELLGVKMPLQRDVAHSDAILSTPEFLARAEREAKQHDASLPTFVDRGNNRASRSPSASSEELSDDLMVTARPQGYAPSAPLELSGLPLETGWIPMEPNIPLNPHRESAPVFAADGVYLSDLMAPGRNLIPMSNQASANSTVTVSAAHASTHGRISIPLSFVSIPSTSHLRSNLPTSSNFS